MNWVLLEAAIEAAITNNSKLLTDMMSEVANEMIVKDCGGMHETWKEKTKT